MDTFQTIRLPDQRRVPQEERRTYDIQGMWQRHHEIVNLAAKGFKQTEIAQILNITPQTVSNTLNSQLGSEKLAVIRGERDAETRKTVEKIRVLTNKALDVYHQIFDDESGGTSLKDKKSAADTVVLELSGLRAPTKIQSTNVLFSATELEEFKRRGTEAMHSANIVVDVEEEDNQGEGQ